MAITDDLDEGRRHARAGIPFYASLRQYDSYFAGLGLADDARQLQDLAEAGAPPADWPPPCPTRWPTSWW